MFISKSAKCVIIKHLRRANSSIAITNQDIEKNYNIPYENIPGPRPLPFIGNSWRFLPYIGEITKLIELYHFAKKKKRKENIVMIRYI